MAEREAMQTLGKRMREGLYSLRLGICLDDEPVGWHIGRQEDAERFGTLVHLSYFTNPLRRKMMGVRAGEDRIDEELTAYL